MFKKETFILPSSFRSRRRGDTLTFVLNLKCKSLSVDPSIFFSVLNEEYFNVFLYYRYPIFAVSFTNDKVVVPIWANFMSIFWFCFPCSLLMMSWQYFKNICLLIKFWNTKESQEKTNILFPKFGKAWEFYQEKYLNEKNSYFVSNKILSSLEHPLFTTPWWQSLLVHLVILSPWTTFHKNVNNSLNTIYYATIETALRI